MSDIIRKELQSESDDYLEDEDDDDEDEDFLGTHSKSKRLYMKLSGSDNMNEDSSAKSVNVTGIEPARGSDNMNEDSSAKSVSVTGIEPARGKHIHETIRIR
ncbi:hypothetical protein M8J75_010499 [Diaphorina citri]|nr:hypothetical protein M8J75_010499 [Diaphorina citri]